MFIVLLASIVNASIHTEYVFLYNQQCMMLPLLILLSIVKDYVTIYLRLI